MASDQDKQSARAQRFIWEPGDIIIEKATTPENDADMNESTTLADRAARVEELRKQVEKGM